MIFQCDIATDMIDIYCYSLLLLCILIYLIVICIVFNYQANGNIRAGDVLIVEKPYASVLLPEYYHSHCYHCLKLLVAPIP